MSGASAGTNRHFARRLVRAWLLTAIVDGLFSSVLVSVFYGSTVTRLFQGVASTLLGPSALEGGTRTALIGLVMHFTVALTWSTVFLLLFTRFAWIRDTVASPGGVVKHGVGDEYVLQCRVGADGGRAGLLQQPPRPDRAAGSCLYA